MWARCSNPNHASWKNYGGRGIKVCARWRKFENFFADMGAKPAQEFSIDRIDNNGPYTPQNCRWSTAKQQQSNRCNTLVVTYKGETKTLTEWAQVTGLSLGLIKERLKRHWPVEAVFTYPKGKHVPSEQRRAYRSPLSRLDEKRWYRRERDRLTAFWLSVGFSKRKIARLLAELYPMKKKRVSRIAC